MTPQAESILELFRSTGAYLQGHFRLTSGLHSSEYLQCALVLAHPRHAETLGRALAEGVARLAGERKIETVVSPAMGGLIIGHEVTLRAGETAVVIEDVVTTGGSSLEVVELLKAAGADVLAAGSIIDRSGGRADLGLPRVALATLNVVSWEPAQCPLCAQGLPVVKPGSRPA